MLRHLEVESGVVDGYQHVGVVVGDVLFAEPYVAEHGAEVGDHFDETHDGEVADMSHRGASDRLHGVTTPIAELCVSVVPLQCSHEVGAMKVARGFTCYDVIFHILK